MDFSSVWFTKHRRCSSVRDALSLCPVSLLLPLANPFLHHPGRGDISPSPAYARPRAVWVEAFMLSYELIHGQLFRVSLQLAPLAHPLVLRKNGKHPTFCLSLFPNVGTLIHNFGAVMYFSLNCFKGSVSPTDRPHCMSLITLRPQASASGHACI